MEKGGGLTILIIFVFFTISVVAKYYKFFYLQDYWLSAEVICDPETENCFTYECQYLNDPDCEPYKYISFKANTFTERIQEVQDFHEFKCVPKDSTCETIECASDMVLEGEFCTQ